MKELLKKIEFPNKGILHIEDEEVIVKMLFRGRKSNFVNKRKGQVRGTPDAGP